ncbi:MAG: DUF1080 domain-containing protein [Fuerstiella sp.]|jgi:hypothetical protein|nr:DUF1080 domain-containing protein [Fuerstiella sp.]
MSTVYLFRLVALILPLCVTTCRAAEQPWSEFQGAWAFVLPDGNPAWLKLVESDSQLTGSLLWSVGSARPVNSLRADNGVLTFERKVSWRPSGESVVKNVVGPFRAVLHDGALRLTFEQVTANDEDARPEQLLLIGQPIPPPPKQRDISKVVFGDSVSLLNGKDLSGWRLSNPMKKNGWSVQNGVLVNATPKQDFGAYGDYGNLITEKLFTDFELTLEYNVPVNGNSGIYLRGMYEAQVVDRDSRMQGIHGPGAIFGRIKPSKNVANAGGEWNTYVLTLVDRHITAVLNGQTVIDNQLLDGCTGGGIQANDSRPGPIFLQGDHTAVKYRNIRLRPVVSETDVSGR